MRVIMCRLSGLTPAVLAQRGRPGRRQIFLAYLRGACILAFIPVEACTTARLGMTRTENCDLGIGPSRVGPHTLQLAGELSNACFSVTDFVFVLTLRPPASNTER
jgi:hypothetical protein